MKKEHIAFWLIILGTPLAASGEHLGITLIIAVAALLLMTDNIKQALKK